MKIRSSVNKAGTEQRLPVPSIAESEPQRHLKLHLKQAGANCLCNTKWKRRAPCQRDVKDAKGLYWLTGQRNKYLEEEGPLNIQTPTV